MIRALVRILVRVLVKVLLSTKLPCLVVSTTLCRVLLYFSSPRPRRTVGGRARGRGGTVCARALE